VDDDSLQTSAIDPEQLAHAGRTVKAQQRRRRDLWRWVLSEKAGREFVYDVLLRDLGILHHIGGSLEQVYSQAALHNVACRWMGKDITPHRELYLQMQGEAMKREEEQRRGNRASRTAPVTEQE